MSDEIRRYSVSQIVQGSHRFYTLTVPSDVLARCCFVSTREEDPKEGFQRILDKKRAMEIAEIETNQEEIFRSLFDKFNSDPTSPLFRSLSPSSKAKGKISRQNFNTSMKIIFSLLEAREIDEIYPMLNGYYIAMNDGLSVSGCDEAIVSSIPFKAITAFFPIAASKVKDRFGIEYTEENFHQALNPMFSRVKPSKIITNERSYEKIVEHFDESLKTEFSLF